MKSAIAIDLEKMSRTANIGIVLLLGFFGLAGYFVSFYFHFLTVAFLLLVLLNLYWRHGQTSHTLLANFGFMAQFRYIFELRGVPLGEDVISPAHHVECTDATSTVEFIGRIQRVSGLPTGIKFCLGRPDEFRALVREMKRQETVPDFITVDGAEGGTGAAPKSFMDDVGLPLFEGLPMVDRILREEGVRDQLVIFASGKLISPGKQMKALSLGADVTYSARGFLLALGCIQALQCNRNTCPVGITTHRERLQMGLDIDDKARRVANYIEALHHDHVELLAATGKSSARQLAEENVYLPSRATASPSGPERT